LALPFCSGSSQFLTKAVKSYPDIKTPCPSGYHFATADSEWGGGVELGGVGWWMAALMR